MFIFKREASTYQLPCPLVVDTLKCIEVGGGEIHWGWEGDKALVMLSILLFVTHCGMEKFWSPNICISRSHFMSTSTE